MKLLILGGTSFLGRYISETALNNGHQVTLFNRNKTNSTIFPDAERLVGDRDGGLDVLCDQYWDAVLDINGYVPRLVSDAARLLQKNVDHYLFISTASVYDLAKPQSEIVEESTLLSTAGVETEDWLTAYSPLKVLCEQAVTEYFPERSTILRPGYIAGPNDPTDRMTYWVDRIARGGEVFVPQDPQDPFQMIDVRDIASFAVRCVEEKITGTFNVSGEWLDWQSWLESCQQATKGEAVVNWVNNPEFLASHLGVPYRPFGAFPLLNSEAFNAVINSQKAQTAGLTVRSIIDTVRDIYSWHKSRSMSEKEIQEMDLLAVGEIIQSSSETYWMAGINTLEEGRLLSAWKKEFPA